MRVTGHGAGAPHEAEEEAEGDLADAVALRLAQARDLVGPQPFDVLGDQHAAPRRGRCARAAAARAGGPGTCVPGGADAEPRPRSRARPRSARGSRASTRARVESRRKALEDRGDEPEAAQVGLDGLRDARALHLDRDLALRRSCARGEAGRARRRRTAPRRSRRTAPRMRASRSCSMHASHAAEWHRPRAVRQRAERGGDARRRRAVELDHREELADLRSGALQPPSCAPSSSASATARARHAFQYRHVIASIL